jgi:eukaryotic-like serine/threonine-protein kinase
MHNRSQSTGGDGMMDDPLIGRVIGGYRLERLLGRGGMASVYLAWDEKLRRQVVVKVMLPFQAGDDSFQARFRQEALATAKLAHPNIVHIYDLGQQADLTYMVMEFLPGGSVHDLIASKGRVDPERSVAITSQMALALDYAHQNGIIHRDVKPANILFAKDDRAVLTDLGIARALEGPRLTRAMLAVGTPEYMSPEQGRGDPIDGRSDLYSLGIVLYELLSGVIPYHADTPWGIIYKHLNEPLPPIQKINGNISLALRSVVEKGLAKRPEDRFQTGHEMADALRRALEAPGKRLYPPPPVPLMTPAPRVSTPAPEVTPDAKTKFIGTGDAAPGGAARAKAEKRGGIAWRWIIAATLVVCLVTVVAMQKLGALGSQPPAAPVETPAPILTDTLEPPAPTVTLASTTAPAAVPAAAPGPQATDAPIQATATELPPSTYTPMPIAAPVLPSATLVVPAATSNPPIATPRPTRAPTAPPTAAPTRPRGTSTSAPSSTAATAGVKVVGPEIGATLQGTVTFEWRDASGFSLGSGELYELIFWKQGQDPLQAGLSPTGASAQTVVSVDLSKFEGLLEFTPGERYLWGVRMWNSVTNVPVRMLSEPRSFTYERAAGGGGGAPPTWTPPEP